MIEFGDGPRLFGVPCGADFPASLLHGLKDRMRGAAPEDWARIDIYVNTARMRTRLRALFDRGPAQLLPRIRLLTDLPEIVTQSALPRPESPLRRRLQLMQLVSKLLEQDPTIAPRSAAFDLADWKDRLKRDPTLIMDAYIGSTQELGYS